MTATDQMSPDAESAPASRSNPANQSSELLTGVWADLVGQENAVRVLRRACLLYTSPSPRDATLSRMPSSA